MDNPALNLEGDEVAGEKAKHKESELQQHDQGDGKIDFDAVLDEIGHFGNYSIRVFALACFGSYLCGQTIVQDSFVGYNNPHR